MITTIHVLPVRVIHDMGTAMRCWLGIMHIARQNPHRLRRNQYKNGQENIFHNTIIIHYAFSEVT